MKVKSRAWRTTGVCFHRSEHL